jgi:hypothetical protein
MSAGKITLYDFDGTEVASSSYAGPKDRSKRLSTWEHQVGHKRFEKMYYHVFPDTRPELVSKNGTNTNRVPNKQKNAKLFDIERPKAKYDNKKTLY